MDVVSVNSYTELTEAGVIHIHILITSFQSGTSLDIYYYQPLSCDLNWLPSQTTRGSQGRSSGSLPEIVTRSVTLYTDTVFSWITTISLSFNARHEVEASLNTCMQRWSWFHGVKNTWRSSDISHTFVRVTEKLSICRRGLCGGAGYSLWLSWILIKWEK